MTGNELHEAMRYAGEEPYGEERADLRAGIVASTIANVNRGKGVRAFKPSDFMPQFGEPTDKRHSLSAMKKVLDVFKRHANALQETHDAKREPPQVVG